MSSTSRNRILSKLHSAPRTCLDDDANENRLDFTELSGTEKIELLKQLMEGMRTEVHVVDESHWVDVFGRILREKGLETLLYSPETDMGAILKKYWESEEGRKAGLPELVSYEGDIEDYKQQLFGVAAAVTTSRGAIADAGAVILWPNEQEPRLMSLVPPVHFVVLDATTIYHNLSEAMAREGWEEGMPANALLISGPSKTADIELTLAFGVHGPKELVILVVTRHRR